MMTDPIADMLNRIRNANMIRRETVDIPASKIKLAIAQILLDEGYIESFSTVESTLQATLKIALKYSSKGESIIHELHRISTPGRRCYVKSEDLKPTHGALGISIISTSQGLMTGDDARKRHLGGEMLFEVW
jgi:small subunit ribosomal protein S8